MASCMKECRVVIEPCRRSIIPLHKRTMVRNRETNKRADEASASKQTNHLTSSADSLPQSDLQGKKVVLKKIGGRIVAILFREDHSEADRKKVLDHFEKKSKHLKKKKKTEIHMLKRTIDSSSNSEDINSQDELTSSASQQSNTQSQESNTRSVPEESNTQSQESNTQSVPEEGPSLCVPGESKKKKRKSSRPIKKKVPYSSSKVIEELASTPSSSKSLVLYRTIDNDMGGATDNDFAGPVISGGAGGTIYKDAIRLTIDEDVPETPPAIPLCLHRMSYTPSAIHPIEALFEKKELLQSTIAESLMLLRESEADTKKFCVSCRKTYDKHCVKHGDPLEKLEKTKAVLSLPSRMTIQESYIPKAGLGVFAVELIEEGSIFGMMKGEKLTEGEHNQRSNQAYVWELYNNDHTEIVHFLDCQDQTKSDWMRFVNCARFEEEQNLIAEQYGDGIYYKVYKKILPGDELLVWYGNVYGKELREVFNKQSDDNNIDGLLENQAKSTESNSESLLKESQNVENLLQDSQKTPTPVDKPPAALNNSKLTDSENENIFKNENRRKVNTLLFDDEESTDTPVSEVENNTTASTSEKQSPEKKRKVKDEKKILKWQLVHQTLQRQHVEVKLRLQLEQQKQQLQLHQLHLKQQQEFQQRQQLQIVEQLKQLQQIKSVDNERVLLNAIENGEEIIPGLSNLIMSYPPLSSQSLMEPNVTSTADFTKSVLNSQRSKVGGFECDFCPASFVSPILLESHQCKNKLFSCQLCGLVKHSKKSFKAHMKNHRCKHCKAFYSTPRQLIEHRQLEHSDLLFTCLHCSKQFDSQLLLGSHIRRIHENKFTCDFCHKTLATAFTLKQHIDRHIQKRLVL